MPTFWNIYTVWEYPYSAAHQTKLNFTHPPHHPHLSHASPYSSAFKRWVRANLKKWGQNLPSPQDFFVQSYKSLILTVISWNGYINRLQHCSLILQLSFGAQPTDMPHGSSTHHAANALKVIPCHKRASGEIVGQPTVYLFIRQFSRMLVCLQSLCLDGTNFIFQFLSARNFTPAIFTFVNLRLVAATTGSIVVSDTRK